MYRSHLSNDFKTGGQLRCVHAAPVDINSDVILTWKAALQLSLVV